MKNFNRKSMLVIACIALVMTITVGGTLAYLIATDGPVTNTFEPRKVTCAVSETFDGSSKTNVAITNTGDTDAYIRATIVGNWVKDNKIVAPWTLNEETRQDFTGLPGADWTENGGYYYYQTSVPAGTNTGYLFTSYTPDAAPVEGAHLELTIVCQAVQAKGLGNDVDNAVKAFTYVAAYNPAGN